MADGEAEKILKAMSALMAPLKTLMVQAVGISHDMAPHFAKLAKTYYDEYVKVGFTPEQALELAKHSVATATETAKAAMQK